MTLVELDRALVSATETVKHAIAVATRVRPPGMRLAQARAQLEIAREAIAKAKWCAERNASGLYSATLPPPEEP